MNVERVYRQWPLAWEPGLNGSGVDPQLVQEWVQCSCISCASMLRSWSGVEAEGAEQRWKGLEVARGGQSGGRGGAWGVRVLEVKILYSCWGMDISVGEPHIIGV